MKPEWKRWLWTGAKLIAAALILFFVGKQLLSDLEKLDLSTMEVHAGWLVVSAAFYLLGLLPSVWYWRHLHQQFGYPLPFYAALRAHYIGQIGKYVPGKALALAIRADLVHPHGVPYGVSIIISFYEVLTSMAAGGMVAALIFIIDPPILNERLVEQLDSLIGWHVDLHWIGFLLMGACGIPLLPGVFNFIITRMTARIQAVELYRLPPVRYGTLVTGLLVTSVGWWLQGLGTWGMLQAVLPDPPPLTFSWAAQCSAAIAFANVAGFVILVIPGGLGVREYLVGMLLFSASPLEDKYLTWAAILLRLDWIVVESLFALGLYFIKPAPSPGMIPAIPGGNPT